MNEREQFEAAMSAYCDPARVEETFYREGDNYEAYATLFAWEAWQAARATPADQEPVLGKDVWEYSFVHSSALGRPDETVTMLTYEKADAFKPECFDQKLVCSPGMFVAEVSQDKDGFKHIADVVELDDIPAGTRLYAITAGNVAAPQPEAQSVRDASHISNDEVRIALDEMGKIADDLMWANHCEITKISLRRWVKALRGAYYKGYAEAGYDAEERPVEAQSVRDTTIDECLRALDDSDSREQAGIAIYRLRSAPQPEAQSVRDAWISVDERLPNDRENVLVFRPDAHHLPACDPNIDVRNYFGNGVFNGIHKVTHWQPLPQPPKG